jgi:L-ascorbate 6-phosphate lactonase
MLTLKEIKAQRVSANALCVYWLGQASFIVKSPGGTILAYDPYLSNSCKALGGADFNMDRTHPVPIAPADLVGVDGYVLTHTHQDHLDPETIGPYREAGGDGPYIASMEATEKLLAMGVKSNRITAMYPNKVHKVGDIEIRATFAIPYGPDDLTHVGYILSVAGGPKVYFTGDTGYHDNLALYVEPHKPDAMICVINPCFRNLSPGEAATLAQKLKVKTVVPCHYDLFPDNSIPPEIFRSNLRMLGIGETYRVLKHDAPEMFTA